MGRYRNANEILSDLENRQRASTSYWSDDDLLEAPPTLPSSFREDSIRSTHDREHSGLGEWDGLSSKTCSQYGPTLSLSPSQLAKLPPSRFVPHLEEPPKAREVPWDATDWVSPLSGYSYDSPAFVENERQAHQVLGAAEEWTSRYDRYVPSVPAYSTYSCPRKVIDWVSLFQILGYILGIFAILGYVACYFALR
jgi:hypothetical protein